MRVLCIRLIVHQDYQNDSLSERNSQSSFRSKDACDTSVSRFYHSCSRLEIDNLC